MNILTNLNLNKNQVLNVVLQNLGTNPESPKKGQIYYNTADNNLVIFNGTEWQTLVSSKDLSSHLETLDSFAKKDHKHEIADISGLQDALKNLEAGVPQGDDIVNSINNTATVGIKKEKLAQDVIEILNKVKDSYTIAEIDGLQDSLNSKADTSYVDSKVKTEVPENAKFTDTVYTAGKNINISETNEISVNGEFTKEAVGLGNVDNTSDLNKPISTATQAALDLLETKENVTSKVEQATSTAKEYTNTKIEELVGQAPDTLDTLHELAEALGQDPNFATTITNKLKEMPKTVTSEITAGSEAVNATITHNLGTSNVNVSIRESSTSALIYADVKCFDNSVTVTMLSATPGEKYLVTIIGGGKEESVLAQM